jgi:hypothetical protein
MHYPNHQTTQPLKKITRLMCLDICSEEYEAVKLGWVETIAESLFDNNLQHCVKA